MPLTQKEKDYIGSFAKMDFTPGNMTVEKIRGLFKDKFGDNVSGPSVIKYLKAKGWEPSKQGGRRHGLSKENLQIIYNKYEGDCEKMYPESGYSNMTSLVSRCKEECLELHNIPEGYSMQTNTRKNRKNICDKFVYQGGPKKG
jgi:hypothetical protein